MPKQKQNLDQTGLLAEIFDSEHAIYQGRLWLATIGAESAGRISYYDGLVSAMSAFSSAQGIAVTDLKLLILAEYMFLTQELKHTDPSDTETISSLTQAIQSFDDALLSLQAVESGKPYQIADMVYSHSAKHRLKGMPKDAFHIACAAHRTRIGNILRSPGLNMTEKALLKQRAANLTTAQSVYLDKQKQALSSPQQIS